VKPLAALVAGVLAGLAAGAIWTWAQADRFRAEARVLVRPASERIVPAVEALAESSLLEANVAQTLHLASPPHISAKTGKGGIVTVSVQAGSRERARQIDAEAVAILTQKVGQRFPAVDVSATVLDPAHAAEQTSPTPGRNLLITGLAGLVAGLAAAAMFLRRRPSPSGAVDPHAERRLRTRIDEVAKRERALARRAGELAAREKQLERREEALAAVAARPSPSDHAAARREQELERRERELGEREAQLAAGPEPVPEAPVEQPPQEPARPRSGRWTIDELEELVRERRAAFPERAEEWDTYLFLLRAHANIDGSLPPSFDSLVADVFGEILVL
jgi:hypothetical protein